MRNLILFIWKNNFFFLFLMLEALAVFLIVQGNYYHKNVFIHSSNQVTGKIYEVTHDVKGYFTLNRQNTKLAEENARLRNASDYAFMKSALTTIRHEDTLFHRVFEYIPARVISSTVSRRNNNWIINKGSRQGVQADMGVISSNGIVGIVVEVSDNFSLVYSMLHKQTNISVMLKKNNHKGFVTWPGVDYRRGLLHDIPAHVNIETGDTIITSGNSMIFPEGIMVGTVSEAEVEQGKSFYSIEIDFSEDYNNTEYVYLVKNLVKKEIQTLKETPENEPQ